MLAGSKCGEVGLGSVALILENFFLGLAWMTQVSLLCKKCIKFITPIKKFFETFSKTTKKDQTCGGEKGRDASWVLSGMKRRERASSLRKTCRDLLCFSCRPLHPPPLALSGKLPAGRETRL